MPIGTINNLTLIEEQFFGGSWYGSSQVLNVFNAASAGAMVLSTSYHKGDVREETFFKEIANLVTHRDNTSTDAATKLTLDDDKFVSVKHNGKIGPVAMAEDAFKKRAQNMDAFSFQLGQQVGEAKTRYFVNLAITVVEAALSSVAALQSDATTTAVKTLDHSNLVTGMSKRGDAGQALAAWLLHSKPHYDLTKAAIADKVTNVADVVINQGTTATLGRPSVVSDAPALMNDNGSAPTTFNVVGLVPGAVMIEQSEPESVALVGPITGQENLYWEFQAEFAVTVKVRGFAWDKANGGVNPNLATLGTAANWKAVLEPKRGPGVHITVE